MRLPVGAANSRTLAANCVICAGVTSTISWPVERSLDSTAARCLSPIDSLQTTAKSAADRHQNVGVINGCAAGIDGIEGHEIVVQLLREFAEHIEIGPRR